MGILDGITGKIWFRILLAGMALFYIEWNVMVYTRNIIYLPTVIMLGSFIVPVAFVYYVYEMYGTRIPIHLLGVSFLIGGMLGTLAAGFLEGIIEESVKLIFPMYIYIRKSYTSEAEGIFFGVASGMGFAALETMGYALVSVIGSGGSISVLLDTLIVRGLLSPTNHAAWTGFFCAVLWSQRKRSGLNPLIDPRVIASFAAIVLLHAFWDTAQSTTARTYAQFISMEALSGLIALLSLGLLVYVIRRASTKRPSRHS
jgi:RsiW-degrading membrane proteinase PrsW (M82 family)